MTDREHISIDHLYIINPYTSRIKRNMKHVRIYALSQSIKPLLMKGDACLLHAC